MDERRQRNIQASNIRRRVGSELAQCSKLNWFVLRKARQKDQERAKLQEPDLIHEEALKMSDESSIPFLDDGSPDRLLVFEAAELQSRKILRDDKISS